MTDKNYYLRRVSHGDRQRYAGGALQQRGWHRKSILEPDVWIKK